MRGRAASPSARATGRPGSDAWRAYISEVKSALPLGKTIERLSNAELERTLGGFKACCPFHDDKTPSLHLREDRGLFCCFGAGCGARGDVLDFVQQWFGIGFKEALIKAGELAGLPPPGPERNPLGKPRSLDAAAWRAAIPRKDRPGSARLIPSSNHLKPFPKDMALPRPGEIVAVQDSEKDREFKLRPTHVHVYKGVEGETRCLVLRAESRRRGKFFVQVGFGGSCGAAACKPWPLIRFPAGMSRPIYGLEDLPAWLKSGGTRMLLVEGEKTRDCAARLLPIESTGVLVLANMGGCNAAGQADWLPAINAIGSRSEAAKPVEVVVWPDADRPATRSNGQVVDIQATYAKALERSLSSAALAFGAGRVEFAFRAVRPPSGVKPGWDLADAHSEGWSRDNVLEAMDGLEPGPSGMPSTACRPSGGGELRSANRTAAAETTGGIDSAPEPEMAPR